MWKYIKGCIAAATPIVVEIDGQLNCRSPPDAFGVQKRLAFDTRASRTERLEVCARYHVNFGVIRGTSIKAPRLGCHIFAYPIQVVVIYGCVTEIA